MNNLVKFWGKIYKSQLITSLENDNEGYYVIEMDTQIGPFFQLVQSINNKVSDREYYNFFV